MSTHHFTRDFDAQLPGAPGTGTNGGRPIPRFSEHHNLNEAETDKRGYPVVETKYVCEIFIPGDHLNTATCYVNPENPQDPTIQRFPEEWKRFYASRANELDPDRWSLRDWSHMNPTLVEQLALSQVFYVDQIADMTDQQVADCIGMGGQSLKKRAIAAIEQAKTGRASSALVAEGEKKDEQLAVQAAQIAELTAQVEALVKANAATSTLASLDTKLEAVTVEAEADAKAAVKIPFNYKQKTFQELKKIANEITGGTVPISNKAEALEVIGDYQRQLETA